MTVGAALLAAGRLRPPSADGRRTVERGDRTSSYVAPVGVGTKDPGRGRSGARRSRAPRLAGPSRSTCPGAPGPDTLDPTGGWSVTGNAIQQALVSRSLTQYARGEDGQPVLVPDLATDLGRHNEDYTEWTFTIRDDATWEDGRPVTADEVAFGICRSLDSETFPSGPGHGVLHDVLRRRRRLRRALHRRRPRLRGLVRASRSTARTSPSRCRSPSRTWTTGVRRWRWGRRPWARRRDPSRYAHAPMANGPYEVESWTPGGGAGPGPQRRAGPPSPTRRATSTPTGGCSSSTRTRTWSTRSCSRAARPAGPPCRRRWARVATPRPTGGSARAWCSSPRSAWRPSPPTTPRSPTSGSARPSPTPTPTRTPGSPAARSRTSRGCRPAR